MKEILNYILLLFGDFNFKLATIFTFALLIIAVFTLLFIIKKTIYKATHIELSKKYSIYSLIKYFIIIFSFIISLQIFGFNLSVLIAGSAALLVGLGLGLQNLFSDFISGIIILIDSTVKVNDIIEVNGIVCQVQEIDIRTTTV
jgi:small-conductance mechanosensitive channel